MPQPEDPDYIPMSSRVDPATLRPITLQGEAPFGPNKGRAEVMDGAQRKERGAMGRYVAGPSGGASGVASRASGSATPGRGRGEMLEGASRDGTTTQRPSATPDSRIQAGREVTPLRALSDIPGLSQLGTITPKLENDQYEPMAVAGPSRLPFRGGSTGRDSASMSDPHAAALAAAAQDYTLDEDDSEVVDPFTTGPPTHPMYASTSGEPRTLQTIRKIGRPLGSGKQKQRFFFETEDELRAGITQEDMLTNPIGQSRL